MSERNRRFASRSLRRFCNGVFTLGYQISQLVCVELAFRYLYPNYEAGVPISRDFYAYKADQYGLVLGAGFHF
jgi:hypothetical protein